MKTLIIVNPVAGGGRSLKFLPSIEAKLNDLQIDYEIKISQSPEEPPLLAKKGIDDGFQLIVAAGGDGTSHLVAKSLIGGNVPLGILPLGRGNDFAYALGIPHDPLQACQILKEGTPCSIDVGISSQGNHFLNVAGAGFDAEVNRLANRTKWLKGGLVYTYAVLATILTFKPAEFVLEYDEGSWKGKALMVGIANSPYYGGGMHLAPGAKVDDGLFHICLVKEMGKVEFIRVFPTVFKGTHIQNPHVELFQTRRISISCNKDFVSYADGDFFADLPLELEIAPQSLKVMVPQGLSEVFSSK